ncbi:MAG: metallopeptidase family protein [Pseudomonadota bacterium]
MASDAPDLGWFEAQARRVVAEFPTHVAQAARDVIIQVEDWPRRNMVRNLGLQDPEQLTGLYEGVPLTEKSVFEQPVGPDVVWLFRQPILAEWRARGDVLLDSLVAHVTVHEFAHHFGWSDHDIAQVDRWWE